MSCNADLVLKNFRWRIENITPTYSRVRKGFRWMDPNRLDSDISSGLGERMFFVEWEGSGPDIGITDEVTREAVHRFVVTVGYTTDYELEKLQTIILQDRHDLIGVLRDSDNYDGYSAKNTTTDIGLHARERAGDEIIKETDRNWLLRIEFNCDIEEND
jgi:hypothetical protein